MSKQIPDPYFQRIRSAVTGQVVGVTLPLLQLTRSFFVVASQLISKVISFDPAVPDTVAVQNAPNQTPSISRTFEVTVGFAVNMAASLVATEDTEPVIDGGNQSPTIGVAFDVSVI